MEQLPNDFVRIDVRLSAATWHVWALSDHSEFGSDGMPKHSYLGDLVYRAKYRQDRNALRELLTAVHHCVMQLRQFPDKIDGLGSITVVAAVPCNPPKWRSLPHEAAAIAAEVLAVEDVSGSIVKSKPTPPAKTAPVLHPEAYEVRRSLKRQSVLLVDDLYHTGATMESVAQQLRRSGAGHIVGLCITRAVSGMTR